MDPIGTKQIAKAIIFFNSLEFNARIAESEKIHQCQPHAFLTVLSLSQDGVSMKKVEHALNLLIIIHKIFSDDPSGRKLQVISKRMLDNALESNIAMLQSIDQGWLNTDESLSSHSEKNILACVVGYLKDHDLISPCEENERLLLNLKTILDSYANARRQAEPRH